MIEFPVVLAFGPLGTIIAIAVGIGLQFAAAALLKDKKRRVPISDESPPTLSTRGSILQYLIGNAKVAPVFAWAGERTTIEEGANNFIFHEAGWHILCVGGLGRELNTIFQDNKVIFQGSLTPTTHPSGSIVNLGEEGEFQIFWGEDDQPIADFLVGTELDIQEEEFSRVGVSSRWPRIFHIIWHKKRLGSSAIWPSIEYVIRTRPYFDTIPNPVANGSTNGFRVDETKSVLTLEGTSQISSIFGSRSILIESSEASFFNQPEAQVRLFDSKIGQDGLYTIEQAQKIPTQSGAGTFGQTQIIIVENLPTPTSEPQIKEDLGKVALIIPVRFDGIDFSHLLYSLLFHTWPHGLGLDKNLFSTPRFQALAQKTNDEELIGRILIQDAELISTYLLKFLDDLGAYLTYNPSNSANEFVLIRENPEELLNIPKSAVLKISEIPNEIFEISPDSVTYTFSDRIKRFRDGTISINNDGLAGQRGHKKQDTVDVIATTLGEVASTIVERKHQTRNSSLITLKFDFGRNAREIYPGNVIKTDYYPNRMVVSSVKTFHLDRKTSIEANPDNYGVRRSSFINVPP